MTCVYLAAHTDDRQPATVTPATPDTPPPHLSHRWRLAIITAADLTSRCVLLVPSFVLMPPHTWPTRCWSRYAISASTSPLLNALMLGLLDQVFKVRL